MQNLSKPIMTARKLNNIGRWANEFLYQRQSVSEHTFNVCQIAQLLGIIEEANGATIDWKFLYRKALNHDIPEALVGDVINTTKNLNQDVKKGLADVEKLLVQSELLDYLDEPYKSIYEELIFDGKDDTLEGTILVAADNIDALLECLREIKLHNEDPFLKKFNDIFEKVNSIKLYSSQRFINEILPHMTLGCKNIIIGED